VDRRMSLRRDWIPLPYADRAGFMERSRLPMLLLSETSGADDVRS
jgi:hypothetical protein